MSAPFPTSRIIPLTILVVLIALAAMVTTTMLPDRSLDPQTLCPTDRDYGRTVILIDSTDSLGAGQVKVIVKEINNLIQKLNLYEWVGLFILNEDNVTLAGPEIALCNPGSKQHANEWIENPDLKQKEFEQKFQQPIERKVQRIVRSPTQATSPIFEMIYAVSQYKHFDSTQKRRLIIISDMLQNVSEYSHYGDNLNIKDWKNTDYAQKALQTSLHGVNVHILYVQRLDNEHRQWQSPEHVMFWENYFFEVGATGTELKVIR